MLRQEVLVIIQIQTAANTALIQGHGTIHVRGITETTGMTVVMITDMTDLIDQVRWLS